MITLKQFLEAIEFKITEGSDYGWNCYGPNARYLDSYKEDHYSISAIFDSQNQFVYAIELWDYQNHREYRWQHSDYKEAFIDESRDREIDPTESLDDSKFIDLEVVEDILEKISAVIAGEEYDDRVKVPVDFSDQELLQYMKMAHERDMTFNEFVETALRAAIDEIKLRKELDDIQFDDNSVSDEYDFSQTYRSPVAAMKAKKKK
jgi:hypothetical protein